jgi:hypothetical protein
MYKATEKTFLMILLTGRLVDSYWYCEDDLVYFWEEWNNKLNKLDTCYLMSPKTAADYSKFVKKMKNECPLLMELL